MCLQWCHVRSLLVDNDLPCTLYCPDTIRLARQIRRCSDCIHYYAGEPGLCLLTHEIVPLVETCCHWNVAVQRGKVFLVLGKSVPKALAQAHGVLSTRQLFDFVDSAPDLNEDTPEEGIEIDVAELSVPLVYGVSASDWDTALYPKFPKGQTL